MEAGKLLFKKETADETRVAFNGDPMRRGQDLKKPGVTEGALGESSFRGPH